MDYQHPGGRISHLGFSLAQLRNADEARMGTILHFQDLTQTVALEEQLRRVDRLATVGEMAARIAHEIRNPLASLSGSIQILKDELSLDGPNSRLMGIVLRETQRLNTLLTDFLLFARPEKLQIQEMDLSSALQETLDLFLERGMDGPVIEIVRDIVPDLTINADPKKMRQVFWNLLNNASEAMPQGGRLEVRAKWSTPTVKPAQTEDQVWVLMEVEDSGVGIGSEHLDRIFDPFFTTRDRGTGLGLSVVHRNIEDQGGRISVRSELGRGTRFTLWIPPNPPQSAITPLNGVR
jgi:two-component system sensor histidine kinase PilS (NtrC family)